MERKAVLIYLRDVRDLEFAKRKLSELYDQEKKKVKQKLEYLETPHYCDEIQKNWIPSAIALGVFGVMTLICFLVMRMRSYTLVDLMRSAVFQTFFWALLIIFVVLLILTIIDVVKSDRRLTEAREANERERERLEELAKHRATMIIFLSVGRIAELAERLRTAYPAATPVAVVYKASWPEEKIVTGTLLDIAEKVQAAGITKTALVTVGEFLGDTYALSKLYDKTFTHEFRKGTEA